MKNQLMQILFLAIFGFLSTVFVFFVPWGSTNEKDIADDTSLQENVLMSEGGVNGESSMEYQQLIFDDTLHIAFWKDMEGVLSGFIEDFRENHSGDIKIYVFDKINDLSTFSGIDLFLLPYDLIDGLAIKNVDFQEDIIPLFIPQLTSFLKSHSDVIPFGLDVPVMYGLSTIRNGLDGLLIDAQNWAPSRPFAPFNFGISSSDAVLDNSIISSQQITDFYEVNDIGAFTTWVGFTTANQNIQNKFLFSIQGISEKCEEKPLSCLLERKLLGVAWGFQSTYNKGFEDILVSKSYPYSGKLPFVRLYVLGLSDGVEHYDMALQFILDYMDYAFGQGEESLALKSGLLPVFQNEYETNCSQKKCGLSQKFSILENSVKQIKKYTDDDMYWEVIEKKIEPNLYLDTTSL